MWRQSLLDKLRESGKRQGTNSGPLDSNLRDVCNKERVAVVGCGREISPTEPHWFNAGTGWRCLTQKNADIRHCNTGDNFLRKQDGTFPLLCYECAIRFGVTW